MINQDHGNVILKLGAVMKAQNISINKLACKAEMQRTQLKRYINNDVSRVDLSILSRLCHVLECDLFDIIEYIPPKK